MSSSLLKRLSLTSELSSRRRARKIGRICSLVAALSIIGQITSRFSAKALLTYWNVSVCNFLRHGMILLMMDYASRILQKSESLLTAAVLTSDSESERKAQ
jgi:hypothetical protein